MPYSQSLPLCVLLQRGMRRFMDWQKPPNMRKEKIMTPLTAMRFIGLPMRWVVP